MWRGVRPRPTTVPKVENASGTCIPKSTNCYQHKKSIFRAAREYEELTWARREDGTLASAQEEVEHTVRTFFEKWFQSRVSVEERWGTRGHFDRLDTSQMDARYQEFMKECYLDPMEAN